MPNRKDEIRPDRSGESLIYRSAEINRAEADDDKRKIPLILATEDPIPTFDLERFDVVDEVLRLDGMELPERVPLIDSHDRMTVRGVLGSLRDIRVERGSLHCNAYFASSTAGRETYEAYRDGHLTDFSVGARPLERHYENHGGRKVVDRSILIEGSAVIVGADPAAKARPLAMRAYTDPHGVKEEAMKDLIERCHKAGMPEDVKGDAVLDWISERLAKPEPSVTERKDNDDISLILRGLAGKVDQPVAPPKPEDKPDAASIARTVLERINAIDDLCERSGIEADQRKKYRESDMTADAVAADILRNQTRGDQPVGTSDARVTGSERDKFYAAASDALVARTMSGAKLNPRTALDRARQSGDADAIQRCQSVVNRMEKPSAGADELRYMGLPELARQFLERSGDRVGHLPVQEIVRKAFSQREFITRGDHAYNTTGSFSNLMLDAANKTLLMGYDEAMYTYSQWVRTAPSAADYKQLNRIRFGELPDPEVIPENGEYPEKTSSDTKESYAVEKYGEKFSISLEAVVNDDLNALSRIPAMQGTAMRRKINKVCYAILTANGTLSDGIALFHASSHGANLDTTALATGALNTGFTVMMTQTGLSGSGTILGITPRYLIVPAALAETAYKQTASMADPSNAPASTEDASRPNYNSGTANMYGPGGPRPLTTIVEPQLDGTSTTGWYLAADASQVDTVEITFLRGEESPVLDRMESFDVDALHYKIRQTFAAKAIDYRGLYQGNT